MKSKLKEEVMDAVGELPDFGNLLLREGGYPHLDGTPKQSQSDAWNDASILPTECKVYETKVVGKSEINVYQFWTGEYWGDACANVEEAVKYKDFREIVLKTKAWREVQP